MCCVLSPLPVASQVFVAVEETAETSLRILDSDKPNLKDAAFAFKRIGEELADPLLGRLAQIKDWGEIDLCLDLKSEHLGSLISYLKAMLKKRGLFSARSCLTPRGFALVAHTSRTSRAERLTASVMRLLFTSSRFLL